MQRSYYQPVTSYRTSHYYEPVTTYRTSYYYEPVTSYRYSCYYDPCTCSYQTVASPCTSYRLRSRCCPATSYLQRTCMTPVTTYQQSFYYEPVTSCCTTSSAGAVSAPPPATTATIPTTPPPPAGTETRDPGSSTVPAPPPAGTETREPAPMTESYKRTPDLPPMPGASLRTPTSRPPVVRRDRIASLGEYNLEGKVVDNERYPRSGARILLVSVDAKTNQHTVTADRSGNFKANLNSGGWLVYTYDNRGRPVFSRRIEVPSDRPVAMTLTQR